MSFQLNREILSVGPFSSGPLLSRFDLLPLLEGLVQSLPEIISCLTLKNPLVGAPEKFWLLLFDIRGLGH
jgi:hypothetical protein